MLRAPRHTRAGLPLSSSLFRHDLQATSPLPCDNHPPFWAGGNREAVASTVLLDPMFFINIRYLIPHLFPGPGQALPSHLVSLPFPSLPQPKPSQCRSSGPIWPWRNSKRGGLSCCSAISQLPWPLAWQSKPPPLLSTGRMGTPWRGAGCRRRTRCTSDSCRIGRRHGRSETESLHLPCCPCELGSSSRTWTKGAICCWTCEHIILLAPRGNSRHWKFGQLIIRKIKPEICQLREAHVRRGSHRLLRAARVQCRYRN